MAGRLLQTIGVLVLAGALMAAAAGVQAARERAYPPSDDADDSLYLASGTALRRMTVAMNGLAADLYWIRAIQHYGGTNRRLATASSLVAPPPAIADTSDYNQLYPLLDITTTLDPRFKIAYRFGAVFLAEAYPNGAGRPDLAIRLLEKGLREQPDKWEYMEDVGFVHYWYRHDYRAAAASFAKAGSVPGAPWWLRSLAATTLAQGGDRRSSRTMWLAIRESAEVGWLRRDADRRLMQLNALDQIDRLEQAIRRYARQTGRPATDWLALVRAQVLPGVPVDPAGTAYDITTDGHVRMSQRSPLSPLPQEPESAATPPPS